MIGKYEIRFIRKQCQYIVVEADGSNEAYVKAKESLSEECWKNYPQVVDAEIINYPSQKEK